MSDSIPRHGMRIGGKKVGIERGGERCIQVVNPFTRVGIASVPKAIAIAHAYRPRLTRFERATTLTRCAQLVRERATQIAALISAESGLCLRDASHEAGRVADVPVFGASECLKDDSQIFSCGLTPHGRKRRVYTQRNPLLGVITAITSFNHPMNQVAHKVVPSIATNNRMLLKPSEKVPLSALLFADLLYETGLPPERLAVVTGDPREIADELITNPQVDLITFTGGVAIGKAIASRAGYKRTVLELGGNDPIIVMDDADLDEASTLAVQGSYKNSGQRCTAVKRLLVHEAVAARFTELVVKKTRAWRFGDPADASVEMGTVIDAAAARRFEASVNEAVAQGARLLAGNRRDGALYAPTVLDRVRPDMSLVLHETFGPVSPIITFADIDAAIRIAQRHGLRPVVGGVHEPARPHHTLRGRAAGRHGERARGARLPARADAVRQHQEFGAGPQGRRAGGDAELYPCEDVFPALGLSVNVMFFPRPGRPHPPPIR